MAPRSAGFFCRLQVAGWNLIITGKPLALKRNVQAVDLPWPLHDADYDRSVGLLPIGRSDGRRVYSYDFKPAMNFWLWKNVWNVNWNSCWILFLPCEYQNESTVSLCEYIPSVKVIYYFIYYLFASFVMAIFCCWGKTRAKSWIDGNICGWSGHPDGFEETSQVSVAYRSILNCLYIADQINNLTFKEGDTYYYGSKEWSR